MNFERLCGMASAASILLILTLNAWLGLWGPVWNAAWEMKPGDALGVIVAVIGWIVTIAVGGAAYLAAQRQINLAQAQIALQQQQVAAVRAEQRSANFIRLSADVHVLSRDVDRLITAGGYLNHFVSLFPSGGGLDGWAKALFFARRDATDTISDSATAAPFGYGERISTVMNRIQRLGDRLTQASPDSMPTAGMLMSFDPKVMEAIEGIRKLASQIAAEVPARRAQLVALADQRDVYAPNKDIVIGSNDTRCAAGPMPASPIA